VAYRRFTYGDWRLRWTALGVLTAVGLGVGGYGALGLLDPDGALNTVAVFASTETGTHYASLSAGEHHLVWLTSLPSAAMSHRWDVLIEVRDAAGTTVYSASREWDAERSCSVDEYGSETCGGPPRVGFGSFQASGGTYRFDVTVSSPPLAGRGFSGRLMVTNPAVRAGEFLSYAVTGAVLATGWVPVWHVVRKREWERSEVERRARKIARVVEPDEGAPGAVQPSDDSRPPT
jgi:hypothetical protein